MSPRSVLVIGSGGYLGQPVMAQLRARGVNAIGADLRRIPSFAEHALDLRFPEQTMSLVARLRPDVVVLLAYLLTADSMADPQNAIRTNIVGVNGVFDACATLGIPRVVFASSNSVYGDQSDFGDKEAFESDRQVPRTFYGLMKHFNEFMAQQYNAAGKTRIISVRLASLHGRGKGGIFNPVDLLIEASGHTDRVTLPWSATHEFAFLHVDDAAAIFVALALAEQPMWTEYNSGGEHLTMQRLAEAAGPLCGLRIDFEEPGRQLEHLGRISGARLDKEFAVDRHSVRYWIETELREPERPT
jgi:nucleoside-diphosphate-sugar epimerase